MTKKFKNKKSGDIYEVLDTPIDKNGGEQEGLFQVLYRKVEQDQTYIRTPQDFHDHFEELVVEPWHPEYLEKVLFTWGNPSRPDTKWKTVTYVSKVQVKDILFAFIVDANDEVLIIRFDQIKQKV